MKLHQCQTNQPNNDMIFGHRIGTRKICQNKQHNVVKHIRQLPRSKEDNYFLESKKINEHYDKFLEKANTFKIQQNLILTKKRFDCDQKYSNLLEHIPEEKESVKQLQKELFTYLNRYAHQRPAPPPRHPDYFYFV